MGSKALKAPLLRNITSRGYTNACPATICDIKVDTNVAGNKVAIAAYANNSPLTRITVAFRAGSRFELQNDLGVSHLLRSAAGLSTCKSSAFITARKLQQIGASFTATGDREFLYYTLETSQCKVEPALQLFKDAISGQKFLPWELDDNKKRLDYDTLTITPQMRAIDLLHEGAYRHGLGNPLFMKRSRIGKISAETLHHYAVSTLQPGRCGIAVVGESLALAQSIAQSLELEGPGPRMAPGSNEAPTTFYGGQLRKETGHELAHVALALPGFSACAQQMLALGVAAQALGGGPQVKWGVDNSILAKAIGNIGPFAAVGFNVGYKDSGLFGVLLTVPKENADVAVRAAAKTLRSPGLSEDAIQGGKNQLKLQVLSEAENGTQFAESLAAKLLYFGAAKSPCDVVKEIDALTSSVVCDALNQVSSCKMSVGAIGGIHKVPYADEL